MEPQLVHSQRLGKQVSRELRGWNRSLRPHCPTPTLREKGASGLWDREGLPGRDGKPGSGEQDA